MKKTLKIALILSLVLILLGGCLMLGGLIFGGAKSIHDIDFNTAKKYKKVEKTIKGDFNDIQVDTRKYPMVFRKGNGDKAKVTLKLVDGDDVKVTQEDNTLIIREVSVTKKEINTDLNIISEMFSMHHENEAKITVYLPDKNYEQIKINGTGAALYLEGLNIKTLGIKVDASSIEIKDCSVENGNIDTDIGSVEINSSSISSTKIYVDMGSVDVAKSKFKNVDISADKGSIILEDVEYDGGSMSVDMGSLDENHVKYISPVKKKGDLSDIDDSDEDD